ncbi:helix-turn-helix transcriptional regulator (plasmid) [Streptomyces sp. BI20]|uniref:helix-turn-helix transcriptional regulator n=1 Tax=Streptomyces sp. BI20 TaxID=3403460 RepID=UPI003C75262B
MTEPTDGGELLHRALAVPSRRRLLTLLREAAEPLRAEELATTTGLAVATVRHHLTALAEAGLVGATATPGPGRGRPKQRWHAAPDPASDPARSDSAYRDLARALADVVAGDSASPRAAGRRWADRLTPHPTPPSPSPPPKPGQDPTVDLAFEHTARMGFRPARDKTEDGTPRLLLHGCPYRDLARTRPTVVCAVHQGLLDGLTATTDPDRRITLHPFAGPELCTIDFPTDPPTDRPSDRPSG